jgi:hypothetical protein
METFTLLVDGVGIGAFGALIFWERTRRRARFSRRVMTHGPAKLGQRYEQ